MFGHYSYILWMLIFTSIPIGILWTRHGGILWKNRKVIGVVAILGILYWIIGGTVAIEWHTWFYNPDEIIGVSIGNFPIEDMLFIVLITVAISSFVVSRLARNKRF